MRSMSWLKVRSHSLASVSAVVVSAMLHPRVRLPRTLARIARGARRMVVLLGDELLHALSFDLTGGHAGQHLEPLGLLGGLRLLVGIEGDERPEERTVGEHHRYTEVRRGAHVPASGQ